MKKIICKKCGEIPEYRIFKKVHYYLLFDANDVYHGMTEIREEHKSNSKRCPCCGKEIKIVSLVEDADAIEELQKQSPSADVVEVKHGKWLKKGICDYSCSICGKSVVADDENELNFCCNCGADMREERNVH